MYETVDLNIIPVGDMPVVHCSQYDTNRLIRFVLTDGENPFTFGVLVSVTTTIRKVDGTLWKYEDTAPVLVSSIYEIATDEQMTACAGNNYGELTIKYRDPDVSEDEIKISTLNFILKVELSPETGGLVSLSEINNLNSQIALIVDQQLSNYYTKDEIDDQIETILSEQVTPIVSDIVSEQVPPIVQSELGNYYTKTETDDYFYNKTETDNLLDNKANTSDLPDMDDYYDKSETDTLLSSKVSNSTLNNYYTKSEVDALVGTFDIINTASGTIATFSDGGDNIPLKSCEVAIVAQQASGTPSPSNPLSISGFSAVVVKDTGANLAPSNLYNGIVYATGLWDYVANRVTNYNGKDAVMSMPYLQAGTYTINVTGLNVCTLLTKDASGNILDSFAGQWNNLPFTFTLTQAGYLFCTGRKSDNSNLTPTDHTLKVVQGSSIDMSEITTHTVSLGQTIYGGTADVVNGNGSKTWIMLNFSDLNFSASNPSSHIFRGDYNGTYKNNIQFSPNPQTATTCITEHYEAMAWQPISGSDDGKFALNDYGTNARFVFIDFNYSTQADFETARNNDKIIVPLINPIPFTFTGAKIPTLSGENNIYSNTGDVEVEYFNDKANQLVDLYNVLGGI